MKDEFLSQFEHVSLESSPPPISLIEKAKTGDQNAFKQLYDLYYTPIFRYIYHRLHSLDDSNDIAQLVFIKAFTSINKFQFQNKSPLAYFIVIARNAVIDFWRKKKDVVLDEFGSVLESIVDDNANPEQEYQRKEQQHELQVMLRSLSDLQREVITLKFINGLSNQEIALIVGKSEVAVRQIQCRAIKTMREQDHLQTEN